MLLRGHEPNVLNGRGRRISRQHNLASKPSSELGRIGSDLDLRRSACAARLDHAGILYCWGFVHPRHGEPSQRRTEDISVVDLPIRDPVGSDVCWRYPQHTLHA